AEIILNYFGVLWLQKEIAFRIANLLNLPYENYFIFVNDGAFEINSSCSGLVSASILGALVFSLKKPSLEKKIVIFLAGSLILIFLNFFRVLLVVWVGSVHGLNVAEFVHVATWFATTFFVISQKK
ncbi:MAG: exosortase/archaeosortase family protein, partial [Candidatus Diapherotrites archaeon]